jgi:serine/threonine protein kinase
VAKLADLGLAKRTDEASHLTATRQGFGTTHYMPYEQALNARKADGRSDIYALGATLYHLLTGAVPFAGEDHLEVVEKKSRGYFTPASVLNERVPPAIDDILARMMARHPRDRYQTASELIVDLERTGLSAQIPSFADPESARNDPWVQSCLATSEPTRLDLDTPHQIVQPPPPSDYWVVRFRNKAGKLCKARASTTQVARRLREARMPADAELCREGETVFLPPGRLVEFQTITPIRRRKRVRKSKRAAQTRPLWLLIGAAVGLALVLIGLIALRLRT